MGMSKYDRLLHILNLLRSRRTLNAQKLAEECQVTERSIYRDIISLSEANVPIYYDNGYKLASSNFLPPLNLSFEEYSCLRLALESSPLARAGDKGDLLRQVCAKIDAGLSEAVRDRRKTALDVAHIEIESTQARQRVAQYYSVIENAISDQNCLEVEYLTIEHGLTKRKVEPYFIIFRRHAFYFVAFCRLRKEFRTFRIDRVKKLKPTQQRFARKRGICAADYFADSWQLYQGAPVKVVVCFKGRAARIVTTSCHHLKEKVESIGEDEVLYRVTVNGTEEIKRWILGYGDEAEVLEPDSLRQELHAIGRHLARIHKD
ncbi:MAG: YafY family transcriptional regulator [candidate division Zixibacteria bacterium]|nr:YafY family transcriptional regulator [candidate division Zixibacteria bacterium]